MAAAASDHPQPAVPSFVFDRPVSTDGSAFELFRAASRPHFAIGLSDPADAARFSVRAETYQMPHAILTRVSSGAMTMRRGPEEIAGDPNPPLVCMHVQLAGTSEGTAGGHPYSLRPGDVFFYDYARPLACTNTAFECIALTLARERAHPALLEPAAHGAVLACDGAPARLVAAIAEAMHAHLGRMTIPQADHALQSLCDLAGGLLEDHLYAAGRREPASALKRALSVIDSRLDDAGLSSAGLAGQLGLSRSALYRVFEPLGGVEAAIRRRRLDRAMRAILSGNGAPQRRARAGFNNEEQFARAFQARFGARPGRYRSMVAANDKDWLIAQARRMGFASLEAWIEDLDGNA